MEFGFRYKGRKVKLKVQECRTSFSKILGLMFKKDSKPLLFVFNKETRQPIHSFFCRPFYAIWLNKNKIVDEKFVKSWKFSIKPKEKFDKLLEIPMSNRNFLLFYRRDRNI